MQQFEKQDGEREVGTGPTQTPPGSVDERPVEEKKTPPTEKVAEKVSENVQVAKENVEREVEKGRIPWYRSRKRATLLLIAYAIQLSLFGILAWWVHFNPVLNIDVLITKEFQENQNPILHGTMAFVSFFGNIGLLFSGLVLLAVLFFWFVRLRLEAVVMAVEVIVSGILNVVIKVLVNRPRPTAKLVDVFQIATGQSFPSGHVMSYVAFFGLLFSFGVILFSGKSWWHRLLLIVPAFFVVTVGPSRIYLGDHWASDVLGAYLFGGVILGITIWIYLNLKARGVLSSANAPGYHPDPQKRAKDQRREHAKAQS